MKTSEQFADLAAALAKAQGAMGHAELDRDNPHFKSSYATLPSLISAAKPALLANGLAVTQYTHFTDAGIVLITRLLHASGQWMEDDGIPVIQDKPNMQGLGAAITYAKRFGYSNMLGLVGDEDDDGESAVGRGERQQAPRGKQSQYPGKSTPSTSNTSQSTPSKPSASTPPTSSGSTTSHQPAAGGKTLPLGEHPDRAAQRSSQAGPQASGSSNSSSVDPVTAKLKTRVAALMDQLGWTMDGLNRHVGKQFGKAPKDLNSTELQLTIEALEEEVLNANARLQ